MNWKCIRRISWVDTRAGFVDSTPRNGMLLDLGSSDGETLSHMAELRDDLQYVAADVEPYPSENYPSNARVVSLDVTKDVYPWDENTFDAITCFQLVEHLGDIEYLFNEAYRVLKPGGCFMIETPQPWTVDLPSMNGKFTYNFYDDSTHIQVWTVEEMASVAAKNEFKIVKSGVSRNLIFAMAWPIYAVRPFSRKKMTARIHWLGWSSYIVLKKV